MTDQFLEIADLRKKLINRRIWIGAITAALDIRTEKKEVLRR